MWEVMLTQLRGIIIEFAKTKRRNENRREKELIKQVKRLESSIDQINIEHLETLNVELSQIREDRIRGKRS